MLDLACPSAYDARPVPDYSVLHMTRKTFLDRRTEALAELEQAKKRLASLEDTAATRIGRLAMKSGLAELELSDVQLLGEFDAIAARFRPKSAVSTPPGPPAPGEN
jgi:TraC-like protein